MWVCFILYPRLKQHSTHEKYGYNLKLNLEILKINKKICKQFKK